MSKADATADHLSDDLAAYIEAEIAKCVADEAVTARVAERLAFDASAVRALHVVRVFAGDGLDFRIYDENHIGPKALDQLALPIRDADGALIDLLLINPHSGLSETVTGHGRWLGEKQLSSSTVRLQASPLAWLRSDCTGVCNVQRTSRRAFEDLSGAQAILCDDVHTAFEAWEWGFGADPNALSRFVIDAPAPAIRAYFEKEAFWRAVVRVKGGIR